MKLVDFDFSLPQELIAQFPADKRDHSRLLVPTEDINNILYFYNLPDYLHPSDLLILNNSRVINAQLHIYKAAKLININLNRPIGQNKWLAFARPSKLLAQNDEFHFDNHRLIITKKLEFGEIEIAFHLDQISIFDFLDQYGMIPLPQYIKPNNQNNSAVDSNRYQTIYSKPKGSVAATTAGLHFTDELFTKIHKLGVEIAFVTLHVGAGTFLPVKTKNIIDHKMHYEWCEVTQDTADKINKAKMESRRVIAVGTTSMRAIESCAKNGLVSPQSYETNIFITPGYKFQITDALITNFHLPKSTLFMLVCAFYGTNKIKNLYQYAIDNKMRFFSYGDAMLITKK